MREAFKKKFRAGPPVESAIETATWKLLAPPAGSTATLKIRFPRPLDHALVQRTMTVADPGGQEPAGRVTVGDEERLWEFLPEKGWKAGKYQLVIDTALEDLAGNRIGEQFEVDRVGDLEKSVRTEFVRLPFEVR